MDAYYVTKYPHPGPRPPEPGKGPSSFAEAADSVAYTKYRFELQDMTQWQIKMRQHVVASALDDLLNHVRNGIQRTPYVLAQVAVWLSYLQEPLPEEFFT